MDELLTIKEAAQLLRISEPMIYRLMRQGELNPIRRGRRYTRFLKDDLEAFIDKYRSTRRDEGGQDDG